MRPSPTIFGKRTRGVVFTRLTVFLIVLFAGVSVFLLGSSRSASSHSARVARSRVNSERELGRRVDAQATAAAHAVAPAAPSTLTPFLPIDVDRTDDVASASLCTAAPNDCSLRGAVTFANTVPGTTINLPAGTYNLTISGAGEGFSGNNAIGDLDIRNSNTSIVGAGAGITTIQQTTTARVIEVNPFLDSGFNFSISGVTLSGGQENTGVGGGAIISGSVNNTTTITDCVISGNSATGAGTFGGGGVCNTGGNLNISGTTFSGNSTSGSGGAISYTAGDLLGRVSIGSMTVTSSSFSSNTAQSIAAGGGAIDIFNFNLGTTSAQISTAAFVNNNAANGRGGAVIVESGSANIQYSRLVGNTAATGGRTVHRVSGTLTADNNWWGLNSGPAGNANSGGSIFTWLQLRAVADPNSACSGATVNISADIYGTSAGPAVLNCPGGSCPLNGLPAFPGTVGSTSTQYVNGAATGSFVAGVGTPTATADSETVTASFTLDADTTATTPSDQAVCPGATANFSTTAGGTGPFHYAWTLDGSPFNGDSASINVPTGALSTGAHSISVTVTGACGSVVRNATLTVQETTSTTDPADQTACKDATANFSTTAGGTGPFSYAWTVDGSPSGGNSSSLSVNTTSLSVGNHTVSVTTTGTCGSASQSATLTVQPSTTTTDPADQTVCQGASASFSTTAGGTGPFSYAWTVDGSPSGGNTSSISVNTTSLSVGNHTVSVTTTGTCGSASQSATLTVQPSTTTTDPADQAVCPGASANFSTTAGGTGPFSYAWTVDGSPSGGNTSSISVDTTSLSVGNHTVSVTTTGTCGSASQSATLTVQPSTTTTDPADQTVCKGASASFSTTAGGTGPFSYAWTVDGSPSGGNTSSISVDTTSLSVGNHTVSVTTTGTCGSASQSATLTVQPSTTTTDPADQTVCQGASASFSTTAGGTGPFSYAWTVDGSPSGGNTSSISVNTTSLSVGNHTVSVTTTGACGNASQSATLTVQETTSTTDPPDQVVCQGATANFSTTAGGTGPFSYAWTVDGSPSGGNSSSLSVNTTSLSVGNHTVSVTTTGTCGSASQTATLTVQSSTTTTDPPDQTVCEGATANFSTTAGGTGPFHYAWTLDGSPYNGDSPNISIPTGTLSEGAHTVTVTTTGSCGSASQSATLTVQNGLPVITFTTNSISMWPPNHQYHTFTAADFGASANSNCDGNVTSSIVIVSVSSDEPDDNPLGADGSTVNDIVIAADCKSVNLRSERDGDLNGRVYTITFRATDAHGNSSTATVTVRIPVNQSGAPAVDDGPGGGQTVNGNCP